MKCQPLLWPFTGVVTIFSSTLSPDWRRYKTESHGEVSILHREVWPSITVGIRTEAKSILFFLFLAGNLLNTEYRKCDFPSERNSLCSGSIKLYSSGTVHCMVKSRN
uniref:Uncharacterized protein n=1 Tax=Arundo donax TaxID=35708 RepID=A0A0A9DJY9_ARUDO